MFLLYPPLALLSILFTGLTWLLAPWLAKQVDAQGNLPTCLRWFQTFDASCFEGRKPPYNFVGTDTEVATQWLRRNPGYTFDRNVLGCPFDAADWHVLVDEEYLTRATFLAVTRSGRFNLYLQRGGFYLKLGWKAWNNWDGLATPPCWDTAPTNGWGRLPLCASVMWKR